MLLAENVRQALESVGRAALQACAAPTTTAAGRSMSCRFGTGSFGLLLVVAPCGVERHSNPLPLACFSSSASGTAPAVK